MEEIDTGTSDTHTCFGGVWGNVRWRGISPIHRIIPQDYSTASPFLLVQDTDIHEFWL